MSDLHDRWPHRWLSPKAEPRSSDIHGLGVFAKEYISQGENVAVLGGVIIPKDEIEEYWQQMTHVGIQIDNNFFIVPTGREELENRGVFNHSCNPNLGFGSSITLIAIKDIRAGEELVFDYAFNETYHDSMKCKCGSENCRKVIKPTDWKIPEIMEKYGKYYSPYLRQR